ncbi:gp16 family protein [Pseudomonas sp.]|uniref:gp16 family protein n=1 Tax=Pseudomonas sp. TaxID=306 RepID=UPI003D0E2DF9
MSTTAEIRRRKQLAAIHAARRDLGLDEDGYRLMLREVAGVDSAKDLDVGGRRKVLDHLRRVGWDKRPRKRVAEYPGTPHNIDREQMLQKIEAQLADMGLPWSYADAIAKQQTGVERVAWLRKADDLTGVIGALHVEQEKRGLLATLDDILERAGTTREQLAEQYTLRRNWTRHRPTLRALIERLAPLAETPDTPDSNEG